MNFLKGIYNWARTDYREWPTRFTLEITAWFMSLGCSLYDAVKLFITLPDTVIEPVTVNPFVVILSASIY
jgi:hypothetical protein